MIASDFIYQIKSLGLPVAQAIVQINTQNQQYLIDAKGQTNGLIDLVFHWRGKQIINGSLENGYFMPMIYDYDSQWRNKYNNAVIDFSAKNAQGQITPKILKIKNPVKDLSQSHIINAIDPYSYLLNLGLDFTNKPSEACTRQSVIFDGRRVTKFIALRALASDYKKYNLPKDAWICRIIYERIAGFDGEDNIKPDYSKEYSIYIYDKINDLSMPIFAEFYGSYANLTAELLLEK